MRTLFLLASTLLFFTVEAQRPNIVVFIVDDMGWEDTSLPFWSERVPNNDIYHTPNMERLALRGVQLTQGYATSICSPSRVSLLTGSNASRHRVTNWTLHYNTLTDVEDTVLTPPDWNVNGISPIPNVPHAYYAKTLPQLLKEAGYYTICIGKAHFGATQTLGANPLNLGFEKNIAGHAGGGPASYSGLTNFGNRTDGQPSSAFAIPDLEKYWGKDISVTEALTLEALETLDNRPKDRPFFLYLSHYAVHIPIEEDKRFSAKYQHLNPIEARYASMIEAMDKSLGDVLDYLKAHQLENDTFILFLSDNGGLSAVGRGGKPNTHNYPLQAGKGSAYEGGVRIPMIASWQGQLPTNKRTEQPVIIEDVFPTLLEVAKIRDYKVPQKVDGKSFLATLKGKRVEEEHRCFYWHCPNNWYTVEGYGYGASSAIRQGDWKLVYMHKTGEKQLFNIKEDISEAHNLIKQYPRKTKQLTKKLRHYLKEVKAQMPMNKETGKIVPLP
ncbi:sulfatase [uncultured Capnocytophaga sp.]|uniref:sulfatase n=1 Tax=uncultured Capnocytophaga sp. TaxID=159273 RepID=UPI0025963755|nr:sulfatase [uncultured Capnocytophaga sp.]